METLFKEMMENYCRAYLQSEKGQKAMLLSMASILNQKNIETSNALLNNSFIGYRCILRDVKYVSEKVQEVINSKEYRASEACMTMCNAVIKISNILNEYKTKPISDANTTEIVDKIYKDVVLLDISKRRITKEEFLEFAEMKDKQQGIYDSPYYPPERSEESKLVKYGYSVSQSSRLSNAARQDLLRRIIKSREVSKGYVVSYLEHMIAINGKKETNYLALEKWKSDLEYVLKL